MAKKAKSLKRAKLGRTWDEMNYTDRCNFLCKGNIAHSGWATCSWWDLVESVRVEFVKHMEITKAIYAYR